MGVYGSYSGRIRINNNKKVIIVGGYSSSYGEADHDKTIEMLKKIYPDYQFKITTDYNF